MTVEVRAVIASRVGLHARPATAFVRAVKEAGIPITIAAGDRGPVNAASPLLVLSLGVQHGEEVVLASEAPDAQPRLRAIAALLETDLDAPAPGPPVE